MVCTFIGIRTQLVRETVLESAPVGAAVGIVEVAPMKNTARYIWPSGTVTQLDMKRWS